MRDRTRWGLRAFVSGVLLAVFLATAPESLAQPAEERLIVPGERIGSLRLTGRLADVEAVYGRATPSGPGLWSGSVLYQWEPAGLRVIADASSGNLLWMSIAAATPWTAFATADGIGFGTSEEQVRSAMGAPSRTVGDAAGRALHYADQGIAFVIDLQGPRTGTVTGFIVYWKHRTPGDAVVVPGRRISSVSIGAPAGAVHAQLGVGFIHVRRPDFEILHWPHFALLVFVQDGRVVQVTAAFDEHHDDLRIRYATAQGVGIGSTPQEIQAAFGEPAQRRPGPVEYWVYDDQGVEVGIARFGPMAGRVVHVGVFAPR